MIQFRFLGPLEVRDGPHPVKILGGKARRVLAALGVCPGRMVGMDTLVEAIWADDPPPTARKQIQNTISNLRGTAIGSLLVAGNAGYALHAARDDVDICQFESLLAAADAAMARGDLSAAADTWWAGLRLWRGPAFADVGGGYAEAMAARLQERRWSALARWGEASLQLGRHASVADELAVAGVPVPPHEALTRVLMLALYRCGRSAQAIACYHGTRQALADEVGIEPGPQLRQLFERILADDPALTHGGAQSAGRNFLPRDVPGFAGRHTEMHRLTGGNVNGGAILIQAVDGMAGVGKTALAVHVAHQLADRFPDGQLFVDLHGHTPHRNPMSPEEALEALLRSIGVPEGQIPHDLDQRAGAWRAESATRRLLVVLDNATSAAQVRPLLPGSPHCTVLVTSRRRLTGLEGVEVISLDPLSRDEAVAMFCHFVGAERTDSQHDLVAEAMRLCGYLPLAIGIVAARMRSRPTWTLHDLVARLNDERGRPELLRTEDYGVAAAFGMSYRHLPVAQQRMYRLLGLHPGSEIDKYHASALAGVPADQAEEMLEALCDVHLLGLPHAGRYRFHDLVRDHARSAALADEPEPQRVQARRRLMDYYLHVSETAANLISPWRRQLGPPAQQPPADSPSLTSQPQAITWFQSEHANLLPITQWAARHSQAQHGWQIPKNAGAYLLRCGYLETGVTVLRVAVAASRHPGSDPRARAACLANLSLMLRNLGDYPAALQHLRESMDHARLTGDREGEVTLLTSIADAYVWLGRYHEALDVTTRAIDIFRGEGNWTREASALALHIEALVHLGRHHEAIDASRRSSRDIDDLPAERATSVLLSRIGTAHSHNGQHDRAIMLLGRAVDITRLHSECISEAGYRCWLAQAFHRANKPDKAREQADTALGIINGSPAVTETVEIHNTLGDIEHDQGRYALALAHYRQAAELAGNAGYRNGQAHALSGVSQCLRQLGDVADAEQLRRQAHAIQAELGVPLT